MTSEYTGPKLISKAVKHVGTGIPSLDAVIGGGYPIGSIILINEDEDNVYSDLFLQVFVGQGFMDDNKMIVACNDRDVKQLVENLPVPGDIAPEQDTFASSSMQIAWRYETSYKPRVDINTYKALSHNFYFKGQSKHFNGRNLITQWPGKGIGTIQELEDLIVTTLKENNLLNNRRDGGILRVAIHNLGSFFWKNNHNELPYFFYKLRCICHLSRCVVLISMPKHLIESNIVTRCEQTSDIVFTLEGIDGEANPLYKDYNGLIKFVKFSPVNSICSSLMEGLDWAFKLLKKKLIIERLTLPPELSTSTQREVSSCSTLNRALEF